MKGAEQNWELITLFSTNMKLTILLTIFTAVGTAFPLANWKWSDFQSLEANEPRLIKLGPEEYQLVTESKKLEYKRLNTKFIDVTNQIPIDEAIKNGMIELSSVDRWTKSLTLGSSQLKQLNKPVPDYKYPTTFEHTKEIKNIYERIDTDLMHEKLTTFTSFFTRYYKSSTGFESAKWLKKEILSIVEPVKDSGVDVKEVKHDGWDQFSIIVSIPGENSEKVVIGSHQDSINLLFPSLLKAPGADDNGSGTVTCLESLRLIAGGLADGFKPKNTLEFHFYSAEEGGLLGSIDVFHEYSKNKEIVIGMLQQDMTGYTAKTIDAGVEPHFGLITDYTSVGLNDFIKLVISEYCDIPYHETACGYACSDHSSAIENGYPASFIIESEFKLSNNYIHSVMDTIDRLDWDHIKEHVKLTVAFAYELSMADIKV